MKLHICTQIEENYGAHDWDGEGTCPQRWKMKGGNDYFYPLGDVARTEESLAELVELFRSRFEEMNDYYREYLVGYTVVPDQYMTPFERSQLEYEGEIAYPATILTLEETV